MNKTLRELHRMGVEIVNFPIGSIWRVSGEDRKLIGNDGKFHTFENADSIWVLPIIDNWWREGHRMNKKTGHVSIVKEEVEGRFSE